MKTYFRILFRTAMIQILACTLPKACDLLPWNYFPLQVNILATGMVWSVLFGDCTPIKIVRHETGTHAGDPAALDQLHPAGADPIRHPVRKWNDEFIGTGTG